MLFGLGLLVFLHVRRLYLPIDVPYFRVCLQVSLLHLEQGQFPRHGHRADVVSRSRLHCHDIPLHQRQLVVVMVVSLPGILELHLHDVREVVVAWYVCQIVVVVELSVTQSASIAVKSATTSSASVFFIHGYDYCIKRTMSFSEKSKKTILAFTLHSMSFSARLNSSMICITFFSLMKRANLTLKSLSRFSR